MFDVRLRLDNKEDLWTDVKLNPELHCPHRKIVYQLTRSGAIVRMWRDEWASPGLSHNGVEYPIRAIAAYKARSHVMERYDPSDPTRENGCTTCLTSWIECVGQHYTPAPYLPWERDACSIKKHKATRKAP